LKKLFTAFIVLMLLGVCFAEVEYALQGDVRVYVERGLAGLEDAEGNPLCEAKYAWIEAFLGRDHAIVHIGEKMGVISRMGEEVVPVAWDFIELTDDAKAAVCYNYPSNPRSVFDTVTGELLYEEKKNESISVEGDRINVYSHHAKYYNCPPFHTDICDSGMNLIFSADAHLVDFGGFYYAEFNDGSMGILDMEGKVILDGAGSITTTRQDGVITYHREQYRHANVFEACIDIFGNALDRGLWKNSGDYRERNGLERALYKLGISTRPRTVITTVGVLDGESILFEYTGDVSSGSLMDYSDSIKPGGEGLYLIHTGGGKSKDGWIYVDKTGQQAVPGRYDNAYKFIDGAAVVYSSDDGYFLIGRDGERITEVTWMLSWIDDDAFEKKVFPVYVFDKEEGRYYRLMNRKGEFISEARYNTVVWEYWGWYHVTDVNGNALILDEYGKNTSGKVWEAHGGSSHKDVDPPWMQMDGLYYHIDMQTGEPTHEQGYAEIEYECALMPDGQNRVVIDERGNPVGPYYGYYADGAGGGWNAFR